MKTVRTSESRFEAIPDFPYEPQYRDWQGMRLAHYDVGDGPAVLLQHGEPTWGYLWRKVMLPLLEAGYRCVVPDLPGFGRSDKPVDDQWYSFDRYTASVVTLIDDLDLLDTTLVCHDWEDRSDCVRQPSSGPNASRHWSPWIRESLLAIRR